jgi:hypothetical protein
VGVRAGGIPSSPPAEALESLDAAAAVLAVLARRGIEHARDVDTADVRIRLCDGGSGLVSEVPSTLVLDALAGNAELLGLGA